jgi:hypothetical protein
MRRPPPDMCQRHVDDRPVALGGASYGVARNSIGSAQLKRKAVTCVNDMSLDEVADWRE